MPLKSVIFLTDLGGRNKTVPQTTLSVYQLHLFDVGLKQQLRPDRLRAAAHVSVTPGQLL